MNDSVNGSWSYAYDDFNRLQAANKGTSPNYTQTFTYQYDRYGNRVNQNAPMGGPGPNYAFDANNRIVGAGVVYDAAGNVTNDYYHTYSYDAENRVISIDGGAWTYKYDAVAKRVRRNNGSNYFEALYDFDGHLVTEFENGGWSRSEIYAGGMHVVTYANNVTYFDHTDWLGSSRVRTDQNGAVERQCQNLPFGDGNNCNGLSLAWQTFTGDEHDAESNTEHTLFRQMSGTQGRWLTPDPYNGSMDIGNPQSLNRYAYVGNNPINFFDPFGLEQVDVGGGCFYDTETNRVNCEVDAVNGDGGGGILQPGVCYSISIDGVDTGRNTCDSRGPSPSDSGCGGGGGGGGSGPTKSQAPTPGNLRDCVIQRSDAGSVQNALHLGDSLPAEVFGGNTVSSILSISKGVDHALGKELFGDVTPEIIRAGAGQIPNVVVGVTAVRTTIVSGGGITVVSTTAASTTATLGFGTIARSAANGLSSLLTGKVALDVIVGFIADLTCRSDLHQW